MKQNHENGSIEIACLATQNSKLSMVFRFLHLS